MNSSRAVWEKYHLLGECCWCTWKSFILHLIQWHLKLMHLVCILIYASMYLCIYIAIYLQTIYLNWLQMVLRRKLWWTWIYQLSELRDELGDVDRVSLEMHLEAMYVWTLKLELGMFRDILGGHDRVNTVIHFQAIMKNGWTETGKLSSSEQEGHNRAMLEIHFMGVIERT
jgi:hypothetical protein